MILNLKLIFLSLLLIISCSLARADSEKPLTGSVSDPLVEAQQKLMYAKGSYKTIKLQEQAIENMRKATKLSLKASKLRTRAEVLQSKADLLLNKANQYAISRGVYITNPLSPIMMDVPSTAEQSAQAPAVVPVPGQPINIIVPKQEEVSYQENSKSNYLSPPTVNDY